MNSKQLIHKPTGNIKPSLVLLKSSQCCCHPVYDSLRMVVLNSAKTSKEIIFNAIAPPTSWGQLAVNVPSSSTILP